MPSKGIALYLLVLLTALAASLASLGGKLVRRQLAVPETLQLETRRRPVQSHRIGRRRNG